MVSRCCNTWFHVAVTSPSPRSKLNNLQRCLCRLKRLVKTPVWLVTVKTLICGCESTVAAIPYFRYIRYGYMVLWLCLSVFFSWIITGLVTDFCFSARVGFLPCSWTHFYGDSTLDRWIISVGGTFMKWDCICCALVTFVTIFLFSDASSHLFMRVCPFVCSSVR